MKVRVLGNINSGQYAKGDVVELSDDEAKALLEVAAVELFEEADQLDENQNAADTNINTPPVDSSASAAQDQPTADGGSATETPLANQPDTVNPAAGSIEDAPASQDSPSQPVANADPQQPAATEQVPAPTQPTPEDIAQTIANTETPKA